MKKLIFLIMFGAFVAAAFPAELRILGGGTFSRSTEPLRGVSIPEMYGQAASLTGLSVGGGIAFSLVRNVALEVDCLYLQKGITVKTYSSFDDTFLGSHALRVNELNFPVLVRFSIWPGTGPYLLGGGEFAFVLTQGPKNVDYGLIFGVGFRKQIRTIALSIEGRYHLGLQDISTDATMIRGMTRSAVILFGFSL